MEQISDTAPAWEVLLTPSASRPIHSMAQSADGRWFLTDELNHRLVIVEPDGTRRQIGGPGYGAGEFLHPRGLTMLTHPVSGEPRLYICDAGNHRIQILTLDGEPVGAFGGFGAGPAQFSAPSDILITHPRVGRTSANGEDPLLVVADERNNRVQVFDPDGVFVAAIGGELQQAARRPLSRKGWPYFRVGSDPSLVYPSRLAWAHGQLQVTCRDGVVRVDLALALLPDFATWRREAERRLAASAGVVTFHSRPTAGAPLPKAHLSSKGLVGSGRRLPANVERLVCRI
ncbi:MAG TPA: NHL repeat-containing protein [Vicinamibacterales bacterium]|jgi:hypothetical protein